MELKTVQLSATVVTLLYTQLSCLIICLFLRAPFCLISFSKAAKFQVIYFSIYSQNTVVMNCTLMYSSIKCYAYEYLKICSSILQANDFTALHLHKYIMCKYVWQNYLRYGKSSFYSSSKISFFPLQTAKHFSLVHFHT